MGVSGNYIPINTLRPRKNGRHFPDDIFKCILLNESVWVSVKISLTFVPNGPINYILALVQIMAWRTGQATSHYLNQWWLFYLRIYASLGLNESINCRRNDLNLTDTSKMLGTTCGHWTNIKCWKSVQKVMSNRYFNLKFWVWINLKINTTHFWLSTFFW